MDVETGLDHKKENSNFMKFKKFISRIKLVAKKTKSCPYYSPVHIIFVITIQIVIFLYTLFFRKQNKKYL